MFLAPCRDLCVPVTLTDEKELLVFLGYAESIQEMADSPLVQKISGLSSQEIYTRLCSLYDEEEGGQTFGQMVDCLLSKGE